MLETTRLWLVPLSLQLIEARLRESASFAIEIDDNFTVLVEPPWPGDAIVFFEGLADRMRRNEEVEASFAMVEKSTFRMVGMLGCVDLPNDEGVEIGYGINPQSEGIGLTTEAVAALVGYLHSCGLHAVTATTAPSNVASRRVLEKNSFHLDAAPGEAIEFIHWIHTNR